MEEAKEIHKEVLGIREQVLKEAAQDTDSSLLLDVLRSQSDCALTLVKLGKMKDAHEIQSKVFTEYAKVGIYILRFNWHSLRHVSELKFQVQCRCLPLQKSFERTYRWLDVTSAS